MMDMEQMCDLKNIARDQGIMFFYSGYFSQKVLLAIGDALKHKMSVDDVDSNTSKKLFSVFVEQVQNIIRYSSDRIEDKEVIQNKENELSYGIVVVGKEGDKYYTVCANMIQKEDVERLSKNLETISRMDKEELKKAYKDKLKEDPDEHSKGAGIGFIEIARKASEPVKFGFKDTDDCRSYFFLKAYI